jgi:hypothetical protein
MRPRIILYEDLTDKVKKQQKVVELCELSKDKRVMFVNIQSERFTKLETEMKGENPLVYIMGGAHLKGYLLTWPEHEVVGHGPSFDNLVDRDCRDTLKMHVGVGAPTNLFDKQEAVNFVDPKSLLDEEPPMKLSQIPRKRDLPSIEGHIDDAIAAVQYLQMESIPVALPELNTFISSESTQNSMSYDELLGLLLVFKRLGAEKLYWKDKVVFAKGGADV